MAIYFCYNRYSSRIGGLSVRISEVQVKNFRSIRNVKLDALGDLVVLVGRNGSGKSNFLEALERFFGDLDLTGERIVPAPPELWFDKRQNCPIEIRLAIELQEQNHADNRFREKILTVL